MDRTSTTHPLQIAEIAIGSVGAKLGVTLCPGKHQLYAATGRWSRDLVVDLDAIRAWGADAVVTLVTSTELLDLKVAHLGEQVRSRGMQWLHLPIADVSTPAASWELEWLARRAVVHAALDRGGRVLVHCKGGLGRAGMISARILIERGVQPRAAVDSVRAARSGAIETHAQEDYLLRGGWS